MAMLVARQGKISLEGALSNTPKVDTNGHSPAYNAYMKNFYNTKRVESEHSRFKIATASLASILAGGTALVGYYVFNGLEGGSSLYSPGMSILVMFGALMSLFGMLGVKAFYSYESSLGKNRY